MFFWQCLCSPLCAPLFFFNHKLQKVIASALCKVRTLPGQTRSINNGLKRSRQKKKKQEDVTYSKTVFCFTRLNFVAYDGSIPKDCGLSRCFSLFPECISPCSLSPSTLKPLIWKHHSAHPPTHRGMKRKRWLTNDFKRLCLSSRCASDSRRNCWAAHSRRLFSSTNCSYSRE